MRDGVRDREREWHGGRLKSSSGGRKGKERMQSDDSPTPKSRLGASLLCSVLMALSPPKKN